MVKAEGGTSYIQPGSLPQCWIEGCYEPNHGSPTGLCLGCIAELRASTNEGDMQCLA